MYFEFEKLEAYQLALGLIPTIERIVEQLPQGFAHRRSQLRRSVDSIVDNLAEGCAEYAAAERRRFARISRRSALEAASQLLVIRLMEQASPDDLDEALRAVHRLVGMLTGLTRKFRDRGVADPPERCG